MDSVHDLGGVQGFGPVDRSHEDEFFHAPWEARMFSMAAAMTKPEGWSLDWFRHVRECARPVDYLSLGYFQQWCMAYEATFLDAGVVTLEELAAGRSLQQSQAPESAPLKAEDIAGKAHYPHDPRRPGGSPAFAVGQSVRTRAAGYPGHTRLPRYARGKPGVIQACYGNQLLPDAVASGREEAQPLYVVQIRAADLWPEAADSKDEVCLDLWESYLEPA